MAQQQSFWFTTKGMAAIGLIGAVSYFLLVEHREHLFLYLPFLILLLCPLMHFFMHRGHGGAGHDANQHGDENDSDAYRRGFEDGQKKTQRHH